MIILLIVRFISHTAAQHLGIASLQHAVGIRVVRVFGMVNMVGALGAAIAGPVTLNGVPLTPGQSLILGVLSAEVHLRNKNIQLEGRFTPGNAAITGTRK
ncbi:MAG: hypothetical protein IH884_08040 [Myxococcales bacterium]|nr:hypothetical protein [Myxococcales bacterium]